MFKCLAYTDLNAEELYTAMQLRQEVFVVEQNCPYLDADGKDQYGYHLFLYEEDQLKAYARLLPEGVSYDNYSSIGRVVSAKSARGKGYGIQLMNEAIRQCRILFPGSPIKISAQCYLQEFYEGFGFHAVGESYLEDDIPHVAMILN